MLCVLILIYRRCNKRRAYSYYYESKLPSIINYVVSNIVVIVSCEEINAYSLLYNTFIYSLALHFSFVVLVVVSVSVLLVVSVVFEHSLQFPEL